MDAAGPASWADDWAGSPAQSLDIFTASFPLSGPSCSRPYLYERTREMQKHYVEEKHIHRMKKYLVYTARGLPDTFDHYMKRAKTARDFMRICEDILDNDAPFAPTPPEDTHLFAHFHTLLAQEEACLPPGIQV